MKVKMNNGLLNVFLVLIIVFLLLFILNLYMKNFILHNSYINNESISGLNREDIQILVNREIEKLNNSYVSIRIEDKEEKVNIKDLGISYDNDKLIKTIFKEQDGNIITNIKIFIERLFKYKYYEIRPNINTSTLQNFIKSNFEGIIIEPKNAKLTIKDNRINIESEVLGKTVDIDRLQDLIINKMSIDTKIIVVPMKYIEPKLTKSKIEQMGIKEKIGSFSTRFNSNMYGKSVNITIASGKIDGVILKPNEIFDFNKIVGERNQESGYKEAPVFINGSVDEGIGGGVCQVSTTLYNAVLYANLEVLERHRHSMPVSYVPLSRDAAVYYGVLNFKFRNSSDNYIYIETLVQNRNTLTVNIYGTSKGEDILLETQVLKQIEPSTVEIKDKNMLIGERRVEKSGVYGYKSVVWKTTRKDSVTLKREKLTEDYYKPINKIVKIGTN